MRQNLTNISSVDINSVDHFYVVGSTTKEGLIEGKSNVKIDLKKAVAEGGGNSGEDFSTQLKAILTDASQHINLYSSQQSVYFIPKYTFLFGPDEYGEAEERRPLQVGTTLTLEQVFDAENYDFLKIYFGLVNIQNWIGPVRGGSGAPISMLADYDSQVRNINFFYEPLAGYSSGSTFMTINTYGNYNDELDQWFYDIYIEDPFNYNNTLTLIYDYKTETFKVVEYYSNS